MPVRPRHCNGQDTRAPTAPLTRGSGRRATRPGARRRPPSAPRTQTLGGGLVASSAPGRTAIARCVAGILPRERMPVVLERAFGIAALVAAVACRDREAREAPAEEGGRGSGDSSLGAPP